MTNALRRPVANKAKHAYTSYRSLLLHVVVVVVTNTSTGTRTQQTLLLFAANYIGKTAPTPLIFPFPSLMN